MSSGLLSCSSDHGLTTHESSTGYSAKFGTVLPNNDANPYDEAGLLYDELFDSYYVNGKFSDTIYQIISEVENLAETNANFNLIKGSSYQNIFSTRIEYLLQHPSTCVNDVVSASSMSTAGKTSLITFVTTFNTYITTENNCDSIYKKVIDYEDAVLLDSSLTKIDNRIILTTTSIARHSVYRARKKPKKNTDPDWIIFIGNIIAATEGAEYGSAEAVTMALVTGIAQNQ